ncbi:LEAF RUST 10 DISEASE-RESISTANCE LOCUS RECEPTOR-LIKE PROTEIN KINASE 2.1 [Trifolium repens]|nr:LEAF RUST 10 DISEASE-RESISTANCE LOCUS RECEPTOR-LIKE PROTEIN KINASE 2.1 [Trifolium repens]
MSSAKLADFAVLEGKNSIQVSGLNNSFPNHSDSAVNILNEGFEVQWSGMKQDTCDGCMRSGERCGYNTSAFFDVLYPRLSPDLMQPSHVSCSTPLH